MNVFKRLKRKRLIKKAKKRKSELRQLIKDARMHCSHYYKEMPGFEEILNKIKSEDDCYKKKNYKVQTRLVGYVPRYYLAYNQTFFISKIDAYCITRYKAWQISRIVDHYPNRYNDCGVEWILGNKPKGDR